MQSDKRTQMGEYELSILLRDGESLLLFLREWRRWHRRHECPHSEFMNKLWAEIKQNVSFVKIFTKQNPEIMNTNSQMLYKINKIFFDIYAIICM